MKDTVQWSADFREDSGNWSWLGLTFHDRDSVRNYIATSPHEEDRYRITWRILSSTGWLRDGEPEPQPTPRVEVLYARYDHDDTEILVFVNGRRVTELKDMEDVDRGYLPASEADKRRYIESRIASITDRPDLSDAYKQACREGWETFLPDES